MPRPLSQPVSRIAGHRVLRTMLAICATIAIPASFAVVSPLAAQGGMGGMGGGMGGGAGRGGRGGGMGGGGMGGSMKSPSQTLKQNMERTDPLKFLLDNKKPLSLTNAQRDTLKQYQKDMDELEKPVYKDLDKLVADMPGRGAGAMGRGGMGGGAGRGRGGSNDSDSTSGRGRRGGADDPIRALADKLTDIQDSFRDRARAQLDSTQRVKADSIENVWLAEMRKQDADDRAKRRR